MGTDSWDPAFLETKNFTSRGLKFEREITRASYRSPTGPKILHYASEKKQKQKKKQKHSGRKLDFFRICTLVSICRDKQQ